MNVHLPGGQPLTNFLGNFLPLCFRVISDTHISLNFHKYISYPSHDRVLSVFLRKGSHSMALNSISISQQNIELTNTYFLPACRMGRARNPAELKLLLRKRVYLIRIRIHACQERISFISFSASEIIIFLKQGYLWNVLFNSADG